MKNPQKDYYVHITNKSRRADLNLKEVWRYRDLVFLLTEKKFKLTYKQTILGPLWAFINPLLSAIVYTMVFGYIVQINTDGIPHILFYLSGNALWHFFSACLTENATVFTANAGLFGKVYFPRLTVPASTILSSGLSYLLQMSAAFLALIYFVLRGQVHPHWTYWFLLPAILAWLGILGSGVGIIISSLTTKYRDLVMLVGFGVQLWMFISPVIYPVSQLQDTAFMGLVAFNPVTAPMELYRFILLGSGQIMPAGLICSGILTGILMLTGTRIFNRVERTFIDTV